MISALKAVVDATGEVLILFFESVYWCRHVFKRGQLVLKQIFEVGNRSLAICSLMGGFVGMILALQTGIQLKKYAAEDALGPLVGLALIKEFGPVITAFVLAGRVGAAFAAEIGSMVVYEEVDSLKTMGINPVAYLAMPRFLACILVVPVLVIYCDVVGLLGGCLVGQTFVGVRGGLFFEKFYQAAEFSDIFRSLIKSTVFGAIIALIGCREGFNTSGGPEGVGRSTTRSVVISLVLILVSDYFIERLMI